MNGEITGINKFHLVSRMPLFSRLGWFQQRQIASRAYLAAYRKGEILYREGDAPDALYVVATGRLEIYREGDNAPDRTLEYLHKGSYMGIISLLTGEPHSVSVRAMNDSVILKIDKAEFAPLLNSIPELAIHMGRTLSRRLKDKDIHEKLIFESTILTVYSGAKGAGRTTYALNLALSLARETAKRVILLDMSSSEEALRPPLGIDGGRGALDLAAESFEYKKVEAGVVKGGRGVDLLSVTGSAIDAGRIAPLFTYLAADYHFIIVDLPCRLDEYILKALAQSDIIHMIANPERGSLAATRALIEKLKAAIPESMPKIDIIINKLEEPAAVGYEKTRKLLGEKVHGTIPFVPSRGPADMVISRPESEYARMVRRVARQMGGVSTGLALGSGAALGLIHIGVLGVLEREGIAVDVVAGSSMGALVAAAWASGMSAAEIKGIFARFKTPLDVMNLIDPIFPMSGLIGGAVIRRMLKRYLGNKTFEDTRLPLKIVATDIRTREVVLLDEGYLCDAVWASIAIPGVFRPVRRGRGVLIDGGILEPVPVAALTGSGTARVIAVNPLPSPKDIRDTLDEEERRSGRLSKFMQRIFLPNIFDTIVNTVQAMEYEIAEDTCQQADVMIHPPMAGVDWHEFNNADRLIELGRVEAEKMLPDIRMLIKERDL